ncbi:MAG: hypothetical protein QXQ14_02295 [Candidatus Aenigmatarchaeota archaeon]
MGKLEDLYLTALADLRASLPRFLVFLSVILLLIIFYPIISNSLENSYLQLGEEKVSAKSILNMLTFFYITILLILTFREIWLLSFSISKLIVFFNSSEDEKLENLDIRIKKLNNAFLLLISFLISLFVFSFIKDYLIKLNQTLVSIIGIFLVIFLFLSLLIFGIAISSEIEHKINSLIEKLKSKK